MGSGTHRSGLLTLGDQCPRSQSVPLATLLCLLFSSYSSFQIIPMLGFSFISHITFYNLISLEQELQIFPRSDPNQSRVGSYQMSLARQPFFKVSKLIVLACFSILLLFLFLVFSDFFSPLIPLYQFRLCCFIAHVRECGTVKHPIHSALGKF